jgi:hypothetical protein
MTSSSEPPQPRSADDRLDRIEARILRLERALDLTEAGVEAVATRPERETVRPRRVLDEEDELPPLPKILPEAGTVLAVLSALGVSFLVLGGAFLVRAVTAADRVPGRAGVGIGFAYALAVVVAGDAVARSGRRVLAAFLLTTAIVIGDPLAFEAVTRFHAVAAPEAAVGLALLAGACLASARRRDLPGVAWIAVLATGATAAVLALIAGSVPAFAAALLALAVAIDRAPGSIEWRAARWPAAASADGMTLWAIVAAVYGADGKGVPAGTILLALALPAISAVGAAWRRRTPERPLPVGDVLQSFAAAAIGLPGGLALLRASGISSAPLGIAALLAAGGAYAAALGPFARRGVPARNRTFAPVFGLALALFGGVCLFSGDARAWFWLACAVAAVAVPALRLHAAGFVLAAAWQSGLLGATARELFTADARPAAAFAPAVLASLALAAGALAISSRGPAPAGNTAPRLARAFFAVVAALGSAGIASALASPLAADAAGRLEPGWMALVRSAALAAAAIGLAVLARRSRLPELAAVAYGFLVLGGLKLLFEDLPAGRPLTLFLAFALYGAALLGVPKLLRRSASAAPSSL